MSLVSPSTSPQCLMFDLDGTLVDTMFLFADLAAEVMRDHHGDALAAARAAYLNSCGVPFFQQLELIHPRHPANSGAAAEFERRKRAICDAAPMDGDTVSALRTLRERGFSLVLSSNTGQEVVDEFVAHESFVFDLALGFDADAGMAKGEPHVGRAVSALGVTRARMVLVGDSLKDSDLARDARIGFIGRLGTFTAADFERHAPGVATIGHVSELPALLARWQRDREDATS